MSPGIIQPCCNNSLMTKKSKPVYVLQTHASTLTCTHIHKHCYYIYLCPCARLSQRQDACSCALYIFTYASVRHYLKGKMCVLAHNVLWIIEQHGQWEDDVVVDESISSNRVACNMQAYNCLVSRHFSSIYQKYCHTDRLNLF